MNGQEERYFDIMAAMCRNRGIGYNKGLPWPSLRSVPVCIHIYE